MTGGTSHQPIRIGLRYHQAGQFQEAEAVYRQILEREPNNPYVLNLLGVLAHQTGRQQAAIQWIGRAISIKPAVAEFHNGLGEAYRASGQLDQAMACYEKAIALKRGCVEAHINLGNALQDKGLLDEAVAAYGAAIQIRPDSAEAHNNLGSALRQKGQLDEAVAAYREAIRLKPDYADAYGNLGGALAVNGQADDAIAACERAIQLKPDLAEAHFTRSVMRLLKGDFAQGWAEYEWRWRRKDAPPPRWNFPQPIWRGPDPSGRTILVHAEQGFGDMLQFVRYAPLLAGRGAKVIVECHPQLKSLLQGMKGVERVLAAPEPLPPFDLHAPLLSLPPAFGTTLETIPAEVPYLRADPDLVEAWRARLAADGGPSTMLRVGLAWAGRSTYKADRDRSVSLSALAPLAEVKGVRFHSLQKGEPARQARTPPPGMNLVDLTDELKDFADTAALIANLDLVVSVDTAVVHLAGAMARPVWTLIPSVPDWRWLLDREDSPWYPTMRLFRQTARGDWGGVVNRVAHELRNLAACNSRRT